MSQGNAGSSLTSASCTTLPFRQLTRRPRGDAAPGPDPGKGTGVWNFQGKGFAEWKGCSQPHEKHPPLLTEYIHPFTSTHKFHENVHLICACERKCASAWVCQIHVSFHLNYQCVKLCKHNIHIEVYVYLCTYWEFWEHSTGFRCVRDTSVNLCASFLFINGIPLSQVIKWKYFYLKILIR